MIPAAFLAAALPVAPAGLVCRIGSPEFRHPAPVELLGVSADGKRVYTAGKDAARRADVDLFVWEAATGRLVARHWLAGPPHPYWVYQVALAGSRVRVFYAQPAATPQPYHLRTFDPDTGAVADPGRPWELPPTPDGEPPVHHSASPDAGWLVGTSNAEVRLYDAAAGGARVIRTPGGSFSPQVFSPAGSVVCIQGPDSVRLHDTATGKPFGEVPKAGERQSPGGFTADGAGLFVWVLRDGGWTLDMWDVAGKKRRTLIHRRAEFGRLVADPGGKSVAVSGSDGWAVYDLANGAVRARLPTPSRGPACFSPDGGTLYTQPGTHQVVAWEVATGRPRLSPRALLGPVARLRFTAGGTLVGLAGGYVHTWDPATGRELARRRVPDRAAGLPGAMYRTSTAFGPAGDRLHYTDEDGGFVTWDVATGAERRPPPGTPRPGRITNQRFTADGSAHVEFDDKDTVRVRDPNTGAVVHAVRLPADWVDRARGPHPVGLGAVSPDGRLAVYGRSTIGVAGGPDGGGTVGVSGPGDPRLAQHELVGAPYGSAFSPGGRLLVVAGTRGGSTPILSALDLRTGQVTAVEPPGAHGLSGLRFAPNGRTLAVGIGREFNRYEVRLIEAGTWGVRAVLPAAGWGEDGSDDIDWSADGRHLAAVRPDGGVDVWDARRVGPAPPTDPARLWADLASAG
ncbi:MAG: WD40 repeat domain-containing protein, partial [Gemmataceae bacterium]|nr:WD40 repeat domain-containing protein [Gemmataceae bacterium]